MTSGEGRVEMWSNCYGNTASEATGTSSHRDRRLDGASEFASSPYDADDTFSRVDCYGSFQVHALDGQTIFAYNGWSYPGGTTVPYVDD